MAPIEGGTRVSYVPTRDSGPPILELRCGGTKHSALSVSRPCGAAPGTPICSPPEWRRLQHKLMNHPPGPPAQLKSTRADVRADFEFLMFPSGRG